jgi:hypothetical protein
MIKEAIDRILALAAPSVHTVGHLEYADREVRLITPPAPPPVVGSTLKGLVDLLANEFDTVAPSDVFLHIESPTQVSLISRDSDDWGRRRVWALAKYPEVKGFQFGQWLNPEQFVIAAQQHFQPVKIDSGDGLSADLDYVLGLASKITAEHATESSDDGFAQRVAVRQGIALKGETVLKPLVNLAPYRTFAEIDQVVSPFVFRANMQNGGPLLALFEGDGGRWKIAAIAAIKAWLEDAATRRSLTVPVIS